MGATREISFVGSHVGVKGDITYPTHGHFLLLLYNEINSAHFGLLSLARPTHLPQRPSVRPGLNDAPHAHTLKPNDTKSR